MNPRTQRLCLWSVPLFAVLFGAGLWPLAGFLPPPSPRLSPGEVAALFDANRTGIRLGTLLMWLAAPLTCAWVSVIFVQLRRIDTSLATLQLAAGVLGVLPAMLPPMLWAVAAFRADSSAESVALLNDVAWVMLVGTVGPAVLQGVAIAAAIFADRSPEPVFPRWLGYFNLWIAVLLAPGALVVFFLTGPFAWNGVFTFWLGLAALLIWLAVMFVMLRAAARDEEWTEPAPADVPVSLTGTPRS